MAAATSSGRHLVSVLAELVPELDAELYITEVERQARDQTLEAILTAMQILHHQGGGLWTADGIAAAIEEVRRAQL